MRIRINPLPNSIHISRIYQQVKKTLIQIECKKTMIKTQIKLLC